MTEAKKQIIELIEPYMDKSLSEGCLIGHTERGIIKSLDDEPLRENEIKILGHYDITAVLKYIGYKNYAIAICNNNDIIISKTVTDIDEGNYLYLLPNKPLHLYTEQEEKDLLKLLNSLNNEKT